MIIKGDREPMGGRRGKGGGNQGKTYRSISYIHNTYTYNTYIYISEKSIRKSTKTLKKELGGGRLDKEE
jgi:hypothetical protein